MAVYQKRERPQNWQSNFSQKLKYLDTKPFVWGQTDCCNFCGQCVDSITGVNPMAPFAGTYAKRRMKQSLKACDIKVAGFTSEKP